MNNCQKINRMKNITLLIWMLILLLLPTLSFAQKEAIIHITTDSYPSETRWELRADSSLGAMLGDVNYGHYTVNDSSYTDTIYIPDTITNVSFIIYDSYGDGMDGSYYLSICNDTIVSYPVPSFTNGLVSNRVVPQCMPNPPPPVGPCIPAVLNINLDQFTPETTWEIHDSTGALLYAGGPYAQAPDYEPQFEFVCLPLGEVSLTMYDSYGDGLQGSLWQGNDGSYYLMQCGDTLVYGTNPAFGNDTTHVFVSDTCVPPPPIPGCIDPNYVEYNPLATQNDSSCSILKIYGCIDSTMFNYDSTANTMNYIDSCDYTLILHDLVGNGWVGSKLEIYQEDKDTMEFYMTQTGLNEYFSINLNAPDEVQAKFFVNAQASNTTLECGFTLINPMGDTVISVVPPFMQAFNIYSGITYCGNDCVEIVEGCMSQLAFNYDSLANTPLTCYYNPGCISPAYLEYHQDTTAGYITDFNIQDSCQILTTFGCLDSTMFNYDIAANVDNGGCIPVIYGCMQPLAFNYNVLANTSDTCIPFTYGCTDATMFNYNASANCDDGSCIPFIYGCTDSTMFNFNPLANADNNTCNPFVYGCTDPSALNFNISANTEDFSCIPYMYGCTDSTALNFDPVANTDNGSCIDAVQGCMDQTAYNYNSFANVSDSLSCLFDAGCITGPGNPYWLNDGCYAWVIDVDNYCCNTTWDNSCQTLYNYCESGWPTAIEDINKYLTIYPNPTEGSVNFSIFVDIELYSILGDKLFSKENVSRIDLTPYNNGMYNAVIKIRGKSFNYRIIKQ